MLKEIIAVKTSRFNSSKYK